MIRKLYAIRQKSTGFFLPEIHKGYTYSEPEDAQLAYSVPRLFVTEGGAKRALAWWLKGVTSVYRGKDYWGEYDETWNLKVEEHRKAEDMEVVPVVLKL